MTRSNHHPQNMPHGAKALSAAFALPLRIGMQASARTALAVLLLAAHGFPPAYGVDIYRWVDENGRVQFADTAPPASRKPVTRMDSRPYELSPEQRREAEARAAREKAQALENPQYKAAETPAVAAPSPKASQQAGPPAIAGKDCASLRRRFQESSECFAPFFNVNGSIKADAFETCGPAVPYPAQECS